MCLEPTAAEMYADRNIVRMHVDEQTTKRTRQTGSKKQTTKGGKRQGDRQSKPTNKEQTSEKHKQKKEEKQKGSRKKQNQKQTNNERQEANEKQETKNRPQRSPRCVGAAGPGKCEDNVQHNADKPLCRAAKCGKR